MKKETTTVMTTFWEKADVAHKLRVTPVTVRSIVRAGKLRVVATTPRGVQLFDPADVEQLAHERAQPRQYKGIDR